MANGAFPKADRHPKNVPEFKCARCLYDCGFGLTRISRIIFKSKGPILKHLKRRGVQIRDASIRNKIGARFSPKRQKCHKRQKSELKLLRKEFDQEWNKIANHEKRHWANHPECKESKAQQFKRKYHSDPIFNLIHRLRRRVRKALVKQGFGGRKKETTTELLGCSQEQLIRHFESQFVKGMGWHNRSLWDHDHIIPLSRFDLTKESELKKAMHWTNLRPMWSSLNRKKNAKITEPQQSLLLSA